MHLSTSAMSKGNKPRKRRTSDKVADSRTTSRETVMKVQARQTRSTDVARARMVEGLLRLMRELAVSYTHLTLPTIYSV